MKKWIIIGVGVLLLLGASIGGTLFFTGFFDPPPPPAEADAEGAEGDGAAPAAAAAEPPPPLDPLKVYYYNIQPEFVVNFPDRVKNKYLMLEMTVETIDEKVTTVLEDHIPEVRNDLLFYLGQQSPEDLKMPAGKEKLRQETRDVIEYIVAKHYGPGRVTNVYFTRFVIQ